MVKPSVLDILYSLKWKCRNAFTNGLGYASSGIMAAQGGIILDKFGSRFKDLRIGVLANYGLLVT
ncbi:MAG: hypothetical protein IPK25_09485 [Saprospiraceae bacterium]|nr:hypothetical protein [Saprospiraceae bacterium]